MNRPSDDCDGGREALHAAVQVFLWQREIDDAIADLAARPLDEAAADQMRQVLADPGLRDARAGLTRLAEEHPMSDRATADRPRLHIVGRDTAADAAEEPDRAAVGGAA